MFRKWFPQTAQRRSWFPQRRRERLVLEALETRFLLAVTFSPQVHYPAAALPTSQTVGDFNGDGQLDLGVANRGANCVSVLLGRGDGTFGTAVNYSAGSSPVYVTAEDFNGDGALDFVVANRDSANVSVLLGNGNGTFRTAVHYRTGTRPFSVAAGDFNGDSRLDLAVTAFGDDFGRGSGLSLLFGNGDGTFRDAGSFDAGLHPVFVATGDFRHSGQLDLAVVDFGDSTGGGVRVFWGNGDGTFLNTGFQRTGLHPAAVAVGDFRGSGESDLAVVHEIVNGPVSILLSRGDGTFQNPVNYFSAGSSPRHLALGDFDSDGRLDIATANTGNRAPSVSVYQGRGDGTFLSPQNFEVNADPVSVAAADFNGDGRLDLAATNNNPNGRISIRLNTTPVLANFLVAGFPSSTTAGDSGSFTVIARNTDGTIATGYRGTVHFTSPDPQAELPDDYTFQAGDAGVRVFRATLKTAGSQALTVTDTTDGLITGTQTDLVVMPAAADHFQLEAPLTVVSGMPFTVTVTALDPYGNRATTYTGTVSFSSTDPDPKALLPDPYTFTADDAGTHLFSDGVTLISVGDQTLTVMDPDNGILASTVVGVNSPGGAPGTPGGSGLALELLLGDGTLTVPFLSPRALPEATLGDSVPSGVMPPAALESAAWLVAAPRESGRSAKVIALLPRPGEGFQVSAWLGDDLTSPWRD